MTVGMVLALLALPAAALVIYALWPGAALPPDAKRRRFAGMAAALLVVITPSVAYLAYSQRGTEPAGGSGAVDQDWMAQAQALLAKKGATANQTTPAADMSLNTVTDRLAKRLESTPDDMSGWILLGRSYDALGDHAKAEQTFEHILAQWPNSAEAKVSYAENLASQAGGQITDKALQLYKAALAIDPTHVRARYGLALYDFQHKNYQAALDGWSAMVKDSPANAPWLPEVERYMADARQHLGLATASDTPAPATDKPAPAPTQDQVRAAMQMSAGDRQAFIQSMVNGLAQRLKDNPQDLTGWQRLGRSYGVLGDWGKAVTAYEDGLKYFPDDAELKQGLAAAQAKR